MQGDLAFPRGSFAGNGPKGDTTRAHGTLTKAAKGYKTTPAMVCGLTDHVWTVEEMLSKMEKDYAIAA